MTRFMWPALAMMAAIIVLFAGAFADLPGWRRERPANVAPVLAQGEFDLRRPAAAGPSAATESGLDNTELQHQARDLQARIGRETQELASLRAATDQARRELALVRAQREPEQGPSGGADRQTAVGDPVVVAPAPADDSATPTGDPTAARATHPPITSASRPVDAPGTIRQIDTWHVVANMSSVSRQERHVAVRRLAAARTALTSGREVRARWLLNLARSQMLRWPTTEAPSNGSAGDPPATAVEIAINQLDRGDHAAAGRTIDQVMAVTGGDSSDHVANTD